MEGSYYAVERDRRKTFHCPDWFWCGVICSGTFGWNLIKARMQCFCHGLQRPALDTAGLCLQRVGQTRSAAIYGVDCEYCRRDLHSFLHICSWDDLQMG